jgi:hypothetical protein
VVTGSTKPTGISDNLVSVYWNPSRRNVTRHGRAEHQPEEPEQRMRRGRVLLEQSGDAD